MSFEMLKTMVAKKEKESRKDRLPPPRKCKICRHTIDQHSLGDFGPPRCTVKGCRCKDFNGEGWVESSVKEGEE